MGGCERESGEGEGEGGLMGGGVGGEVGGYIYMGYGMSRGCIIILVGGVATLGKGLFWISGV